MSEAPVPADVYEEFAQLRDHSPVVKSDEGPWRVARYEDVRRILKSHDEFSSDVSQRLREDAGASPTMLFSDPPVHDRLRALVSRAFTPKRVAEQEAQIKTRCEALVSEMVSNAEADLVTAFAAPLPVGVIAGMLSVEDGDFVEFKHWSDTILSNIGEILIGTPSDAAVAAAMD